MNNAKFGIFEFKPNFGKTIINYTKYSMNVALFHTVSVRKPNKFKKDTLYVGNIQYSTAFTSMCPMYFSGVKYFWTSGRLCNFDGCDRPDFFPKNINGWFWSANQARLSPTNATHQFHDWSFTGGYVYHDT